MSEGGFACSRKRFAINKYTARSSSLPASPLIPAECRRNGSSCEVSLQIIWRWRSDLWLFVSREALRLARYYIYKAVGHLYRLYTISSNYRSH